LFFSLFISEHIKKEKEIIEMEKQSFDENFQKDLELKKAKLIEILVKYNNFYTLYKYF